MDLTDVTLKENITSCIDSLLQIWLCNKMFNITSNSKPKYLNTKRD